MSERLRIYAGTYDGVHVLGLGGGHCEPVGHAFAGEIVQALGGCREKTQRAFVGLNNGLYRTENGGAEWRRVLDGDFRSVTVDPTDDNVVYAGTDPVHLFRSEDGGSSWEELLSLQSLPEETHHKLGEDGPADMEGYKQQDFRHRRQDWWFPVPPHRGHVLQMFVHPDDPNLLLVSIEHGGVARSRDRGQTWEDVSEGIDYLDIHFVTSLPHRFDRYFVSSARGFYSTDDPAKGWTRAQKGCTRSYFHDIAFLPAEGGDPVMVIATADGSPGFWPATKGREAWDHSQVGARAALFRSGDAGQSWQRLGVGGGLPEEMDAMIWSLCGHPSESNGLFAGIGESAFVPSPTRKSGKGAVMASSDGGESWQAIKDDMAAIEHVLATPY